MRVVLVAGWNEASRYMRTFIDGTRHIDGLAGYGFDCTLFPDGRDDLTSRTHRFAAWLTALKMRDPGAFPLCVLGYSAGGLLPRAFLRAYPERHNEIAAVVQVGAPNGGLVTNWIAHLIHLVLLPDAVVRDMDVASDFTTWLNGTSGTWLPDVRHPGRQRWVLDEKPWVAPVDTRILQIAGRMPRFNMESDGVVEVESATLEDNVPTVFLDGPRANHLNLGAVFNPLAFAARGFTRDDVIWPQVVDIAARFFRSEFKP